ncbi:carbohydrate ABC transporter permease [Breznakiella homolactica]|uniref:Sugar ABC transporter permease n=1 Tax=Breznakiella homolactica TaxID=2798577 RepID=A0A7T7XNH8_9SPIR|nr:sugar ABC transporter permease [Breznakiella homolactica]QQO09507.1 sugar ABC transporter permease [Breznakiella homolactica]
MKARLKDTPGIILFLLPALFLFIVFYVIPIGSVGFMSFFKWNGISDAEFTGFSNYTRNFANPVFWRSIRNNVIWALAACFIQVPLALLMALLLSKKPKGWKFFRTVYFLPQVISGIAIATLWSSVYNSEFGLLNGILRAVGLGAHTRNWLGDPSTAFFCVLVYGLLYIGYYMVIMMASITTIDESYYEAATIDGANRLQMDRHITIPFIRYALLTCITLAAVFGLRTFEQVYLLTNGGPANRTSVLVLFLYNQMRNNNYGGANASSMMLILTGVVVIALIRVAFSLGRRNDD